MMRRTTPINAELAAALVQGASEQNVGSTSYSVDPHFPAFRTPVGKDLVVYFPKNSVITVDGKEINDILSLHCHSLKKGNRNALYRCIQGLSGGVYTEELGYNGDCPFCNGVADSFELYNKKMDAFAQSKGIDRTKTKTDELKNYSSALVGEMAVRKSEEYVVFPIVIISDTTVLPATPDFSKMTCEYVVMKKQRYEEKITTPLSKEFVPLGHPAGLFYQWNFSYVPSQGQQQNARDAGKNAKYVHLTDPNAMSMLAPYIEAAEKLAAPFTKFKAIEVLTPAMFFPLEEISKENDAFVEDTRKMIANFAALGTVANTAPAQTNAASALASFGIAPTTEQPALNTTKEAQPTGGSGFGA